MKIMQREDNNFNPRKYTENEWINISSSPYDINDKFIELAKEYFDLDDVDILKTGMLGYINEVMALIARDGINHRDIHYDEFFLNTAVLPKSIYNEAKMYKVNVGTAKPATIKLYLALSKKELLEAATDRGDNSGVKEFFITDEYFTIEGKYNYMVSHPIVVTMTPIQKINSIDRSIDYTISANYILDDSTANYRIRKQSPYVKTWKEYINGEEFVYFVLDVYQIESHKKTFTISSNNISDIVMYDIDFPDQIADFKIKYRHAGREYDIPAYFNSNTTPEDSQYAFYTYPDTNTLQIFFSSLPNAFRPKFNSELEIEVITTKGAEGNFEYVGDILFRFKERYKSNMRVLVRPMHSSRGGRDRPTLLELKHRILEQKTIRDNLITDTDLDTFFSSMVDQASVNNSTVRFIRKRDDVLRRLFSAYILMRDRNENIVPTNTIDIEIDEKFMRDRDNVIKPGTKIVYNAETDEYRFMGEDEMPEDIKKPDLLYSMPFLLVYKDHPVPQFFYYRNTVNREVGIDHDYVNNRISGEFLVMSLKVERNSFMSEAYEFDLTVTSSLTETEIHNDVMVRAILKSGNREYGYFDFKPCNKSSNSFKGMLMTDDTVSDDGKFSIVNTLRNIETGEIMDKVWVPENMDIEFAILHKGYKDKSKKGTFRDMYDLANYSTAMIFSTRDRFSFYRPLDYIMKSELKIDKDGTFALRNIPLVASRFFMSRDNYFDFYDIFTLYENALTDNMSKLENNTEVDIKLFNTYGKCLYSDIDTTHLSLSFNIKLHVNFTHALDRQIKEYIMEIIERANEIGTISISNIIRKLENRFEEIKYIEYNHMNDTHQQKIEYQYPRFEGLTAEQLIKYVPEFINVEFNTNNDNEAGEYRPNIEINYI